MAIQLEVRYERSAIEAGLQSYALQITVLTATDMPKEIFQFQTRPDSDPPEMFRCIADPVDLIEVPVGSANLGEEMPYFRSDSVTLRFRDMESLEQNRADIDEDIRRLVNALKIEAALDVTEDVTYE